MNVALFLLSFVVGVQEEAPVEPVEKMDVPSLEERKEALRIIKDLFKREYSMRGTESRKALGSNLLDQASTTNDSPASLFVLLEEARTLAASAGDLETATAAAAQTAANLKGAPWAEPPVDCIWASRESIMYP